MIKLYIKNDCNECDIVKEKLENMVVAHNVINVDEINSKPSFNSYPVIVDDGKAYNSMKDIDRYIEELQKTYNLWNKYQSDVCYIDEDGEVC